MLTLTFVLLGLLVVVAAAKVRLVQNLPDDGPPFEFQPDPEEMADIPYEPSLEELWIDGAGDA